MNEVNLGHPVPQQELAYVEQGRAVFRQLFPPGSDFDATVWDLRHLRHSRHTTSNVRVYFTRNNSTDEALPARFADIIKAYVVLNYQSLVSLASSVEAARMLWKAIESRIGSKETFDWLCVAETDLLGAELQMLQSWGKARTHKKCSSLMVMMRTLAAASCGPIVRQLTASFVTPRPEDFERYTLAGQESRLAKMPSDEAIQAVGGLFANKTLEPWDRLILCVLAIMLATGFRIGEALTLPFNCLIAEGAGRSRRFGLRYHKEKSRGGEKQLATRWMTPKQAKIVLSAVRETRGLTKNARLQAQRLEARPDTVQLPGHNEAALLSRAEIEALLGMAYRSVNRIPNTKLRKTQVQSKRTFLYSARDVMAYLLGIRGDLWMVDRRDGTHQMLSESLFICFRNFRSAQKGTNRLLVDPLTAQHVNDFLQGRRGNDGTLVLSVFERFELRDVNGQFFSMHSHQFRHWVTTKAAQAGVPDHVIARWQGREHIGDLTAYKHLTPSERVETFQAALKRGGLRGPVVDMYFSLYGDVREAFINGQLQAVHVTPLGLCIHDFKVSPCPKFLNCVNDCEDYVLDTSNQNHINGLVLLQVRTKETLDQALQQRAAGGDEHTENWIAAGEATLRGVDRILQSANASNGNLVRPFEGKRSHFKPGEPSLG